MTRDSLIDVWREIVNDSGPSALTNGFVLVLVSFGIVEDIADISLPLPLATAIWTATMS